MAINEWLIDDPTEKYWMEITIRDDIGTNGIPVPTAGMRPSYLTATSHLGSPLLRAQPYTSFRTSTTGWRHGCVVPVGSSDEVESLLDLLLQ